MSRRHPRGGAGRGRRSPSPGVPLDESELIQRASSGDSRAFDDLVTLKRDRVYRIAWQVVRNVEDARDVAQGVFIRLWRVLPRYRPDQPFDTWLYRITVNLAIDFQRRRRAGGPPPMVPLEGIPAASAPGPDRLDRAEMRRVYEAISGELTERQRLVFTLREVDGLPAEEVARVLGVTASTVRNTHFQARAVLRDALRRRFPEYAPRADRPGDTGEES